jgi:hypothetical protein
MLPLPFWLLDATSAAEGDERWDDRFGEEDSRLRHALVTYAGAVHSTSWKWDGIQFLPWNTLELTGYRGGSFYDMAVAGGRLHACGDSFSFLGLGLSDFGGVGC